MWIAILVFIVTSFMLVTTHVRGWLPAVELLGNWLFLVPIAWAILAIPLTLFAPTWMVQIWIGSIWAAPIVIFLIDSAIHHPLDLILAAPPAVAQVWAIATIMEAVHP